MTTGFAFVREHAPPINGLRPYTPFNLTSLALKVAEDADKDVADALLALLTNHPKCRRCRLYDTWRCHSNHRSFRMFPRDVFVSNFMVSVGMLVGNLA